MEVEGGAWQAQEAGPETWPKVAIIILNWNGWRDTLECLESVEALTYPNYEVILVDNGSVDDFVARICDWVMDRLDRWGPVQDRPAVAPEALAPGTQVVLSTSRLLLVRSDENLGFCSGNNLGMRLAARSGADFLLILNNDTIVTPDEVPSGSVETGEAVYPPGESKTTGCAARGGRTPLNDERTTTQGMPSIPR